jgi:hypothetical protein
VPEVVVLPGLPAGGVYDPGGLLATRRARCSIRAVLMVMALDALLAKLAAGSLIKAGWEAADGLHAHGRRSGGAEPAGAGRRERAGRGGGGWPPRTRTGWSSGSACRTGPAATAPR